MTDDAPSISERYIVATTTKNMRVRGHTDKDRADIVIASGFAKGPGATFARCRAEFDQAHAQYRGKTDAANARWLACMKMPSLKAGKAAALEMATSRTWGLAPAVIVELSWQALSAWLDPTCAPCDGRGFTGGYDGPQILCTHCRGTGSRRLQLGRSDAERRLAGWLAVQIDSAVSAHAGATARALKDACA